MAGCAPEAGQPEEDTITVHVNVLLDQPQNPGYRLRSGQPQTAGIYEFYLKNPDLPGSGAFREIDSIPLHEVKQGEYYGEKTLNKIEGQLCVGYPSTNFIDGKSCIKIDQSLQEADITLHYWETKVGIIGGK